MQDYIITVVKLIKNVLYKMWRNMNIFKGKT